MQDYWAYIIKNTKHSLRNICYLSDMFSANNGPLGSYTVYIMQESIGYILKLFSNWNNSVWGKLIYRWKVLYLKGDWLYVSLTRLKITAYHSETEVIIKLW